MTQQPLYCARNISKRFGNVWALRDVSLEIYPGQIVGLVGANGAGKSTVTKILAGALAADQGELLLEGAPVAMRSMVEAWSRGIAFVSQELNLFPSLSVAENLGLVPGGAGRVVSSQLKKQAKQVLSRLGLELDLSTKVETLPLADRQIIEIARALLQRPRILILDEPTSALHASETQRLHEIVRDLRNDGVGIVYISHFLEELLDVADKIVVFRDGQRVALDDGDGSISLDRVLEAMLGERRKIVERASAKTRNAHRNVSGLEITGLNGTGTLSVDFVRAEPGEIVGLAGLASAGVEELLAILFGRKTPLCGQINLPSGKPFRPNTPHLVKAGVAYCPSDRKKLGLAVEQTIRENVAAVRDLSLARDGFLLSRGRQAQRALSRCRSIGVKFSSLDQPVRSLSGGNQQKVVFAGWLEADPSLLLLDDPTRGVDIGAKSEMYGIMRDIADSGRVVLFASSDPAEFEMVADRVLVFVNGRLSHELRPGFMDEHSVVAAMNTPSNGLRKAV